MNARGLTLIEIMIAMVIGLIVMSAAMSAFFTMQSAALDIDQKTAISVNGRGAMYLIEENIRLMGFNPEGGMNPADIITTAGPGYLKFKRNKDLERPSESKTVSIGLRKSDDPDRDGIVNGNISRLLIDKVPAADHITALRFAYAFDDDGDGAIDVSDKGQVRWAFDSNGDGWLDTELDARQNGEIKKASASPMNNRVKLEKIRVVRIWLVARSEHTVRETPANKAFNVGGENYLPKNSNYAHVLFTTAVKCRNMF